MPAISGLPSGELCGIAASMYASRCAFSPGHFDAARRSGVPAAAVPCDSARAPPGPVRQCRRARDQLRPSNRKDNYPGNLAIPMAALRLAVERGLENVTVEDITAEAGVSLRTFGNYFSSKYEAICAPARTVPGVSARRRWRTTRTSPRRPAESGWPGRRPGGRPDQSSRPADKPWITLQGCHERL